MEGPRVVIDQLKKEFPGLEIKLGLLFNAQTGEEGVLLSISIPGRDDLRLKISPSEIKKGKGLRNMGLIWTRQIRKELAQ